MNLRKIVTMFALTAFFSFAGLGFQASTAQSDVLAGPGHWITDNDVG